MQLNGIRSFKQHTIEGEYDVILIGSGIGSMTAGVVLAKEGRRVLILEQHYTPGGYTHVFKRNGYEWDVGIHYIGDVHRERAQLAVLFRYISDGALEWAEMGEVYDRIIFGDEHFDLHKGREAFVENLKLQFLDPADHEAIDKYVELIYQASRASGTFFAAKALPAAMADTVGEQMGANFKRFADSTTLEVLSELTDNKKLIAVLTGQYGDYGLPPGRSSFGMHAVLVKHYINGGAFPVGGSARIAESVGAVLAKHDGLLLTNAKVDEIIVEDNVAVGVRIVDGTELRAPLIISGAGAINTYGDMLPSAVAEQHGLDKQLTNVQPSAAHFGLYLGFKHSPSELNLPKTNFWIYPEDGYDHDVTFETYSADFSAEFPVVYISFPSAKDPDWERRYPGRATIDIITLAKYEWFAEWEGTKWHRRGEAYDQFKAQFTERLLKVLFRYLPQLEGKIDHCELSTPLSTKAFTGYKKGELYGLNHDPSRFQQTFLRAETPVKNLYLTGQDIVTAGIGAAMAAGVVTASAILQEDMMSEIRKRVLEQ